MSLTPIIMKNKQLRF